MAARARTFQLATLLAGLTMLISAAPSHASGVAVNDIAGGATATDMAQALAGGGLTISNVTFTGDARAAGSFTNGAGSIGFDTGIVMSSGYVETHAGEETTCTRGVEGPNNCYEGDGGDGANSASLQQPGDADLDALLSGNTTSDATVLEFDFVPQQSKVQFSYVFSSEEYNDFANSSFNDVFAFFINGTNCALVPGTTDPVAINTINNGNPDGDTTPHNQQYYRDNIRPTPGAIDTQMDGLTTVLTCTANVTADQTNHLKLAIADVSDDRLDSAVFIQSGSFFSGEVLTVAKDGTGAGTVTSNPAGISCGSTCSAHYLHGTDVTLTPTPAAGSRFAGWSGACTGTGSCLVTMSEARNVNATFDTITHVLTVARGGTGSGSVSSQPAGISCGVDCNESYAHGTQVTLAATPAADSQFAGWSGACTGTGSCAVTMDQARNVTALFNTSSGEGPVGTEGSGTVLVKRPGEKAFTPLTFGENLELGTIIDTTNGVVKLIVPCADCPGGIQSGEFYGGRFVVLKTRGAKPTWELMLEDAYNVAKPKKNGIPKAFDSSYNPIASMAAKKRTMLWGKAKGRWRTTGRYGAATVRGTQWLVDDRQKGKTKIRVKKGSVKVRDFVKKKTRTLKAGKSYVARAKTKKRK